MTSYYNFQEIATFILEADEKTLDTLARLMQVRRDTMNAEKAFVTANTVYLWDSVRTIYTLRPKAIADVRGTIVEINEEDYLVRIEEGDKEGHRYRLKGHHFTKGS